MPGDAKIDSKQTDKPHALQVLSLLGQSSDGQRATSSPARCVDRTCLARRARTQRLKPCHAVFRSIDIVAISHFSTVIQESFDTPCSERLCGIVRARMDACEFVCVAIGEQMELFF